MIRVVTKQYCKDCGSFDPVVLKRETYRETGTDILKTDTTVVCANRDYCIMIQENLKGE